MSFTTIRAAINSKLQSISNIQKVYNYPVVPREFPAATIWPSGAESDYETTDENLRTYTFVVKLFYNTEDGDENAVDALESLVDEVVDAFDQDPQLATESISMPAKYTMIHIIPTPSVWVWFEDYITADISIEYMVSYDFS